MSLNPAPDRTRNQPSNNVYGGGHSVNPNQVFGNPNPQAGANVPWNGLPVFPNPTSHSSNPQSAYPQIPYNYPPQNPGHAPYGNLNPYQPQQPFAFGNPPPYQGPSYFRTTTRQPSLLDQFLYNKQGGRRRNAASMLDIMRPHVILMISVCNALVGAIFTISRRNH